MAALDDRLVRAGVVSCVGGVLRSISEHSRRRFQCSSNRRSEFPTDIARVQPEPPQPEALSTPQPQALPNVLVVDHPKVNKVYLIHLKYPQDLNDNSPENDNYHEKGQPRSLEDGWHTINAPAVTGNLRTASRHMGLFVHYDPTTKVGALFIGTGAEPDRPQRFVPWRGTQRLPKQPPRPLIPDPEDAFMQHQGYLNYSHLICARVVQQGEPGVENFFPGLVHVRQILAGVKILHTSLPLESMSYLKDLHEAYWNGVRYSESGEIVLPGHWGGTGGAQGVSDPVDPATGVSHSKLMQIAELQAVAADEQARLAVGELDDRLGCCVVVVSPLVGEMISL